MSSRVATFSFSKVPIETASLRTTLADPACGGFTSFEGWVRDHNEGRRVLRLEYEAFELLAIREGERILAEAVDRFGIEHAACVHRVGDLAIGEMAVWVGVSARHRHEAFLACRYIIDEVKHRVPIWKKEHYEDGDSGWVNCERCADPALRQSADSGAAAEGSDHVRRHAHDHIHAHKHDHGHGPRGDGARAGAVAATPDYSRQVALKEVGREGQDRLRKARVLVVGCGGLGVPVMTYLAGAGVGTLGLVDGDCLEASNLHRQTLYALSDVGRPKAELAAARLRALNSEIEVHTHAVRLDGQNAEDLVSSYDLVVDCTDNFSTKFLLNDVCVRLRKPVVFSSVYQYEGQLQVVRPDRAGACLRCVWPEATRDGLVGNCSEAGVLGPVPGVFGSLQALEALKILLDLPGQLSEELLVLDLTTLSISRVRTRRADSCPEHAAARGSTASDRAVIDPALLEVELESLDRALEEGFEIVDIREPREVRELPMPTPRARHLPMGQLLHGQPPFTPAGKCLLVCASGRRSLAAAQELRSRGCHSVYSLRGGITALACRS